MGQWKTNTRRSSEKKCSEIRGDGGQNQNKIMLGMVALYPILACMKLKQGDPKFESSLDFSIRIPHISVMNLFVPTFL